MIAVKKCITQRALLIHMLITSRSFRSVRMCVVCAILALHATTGTAIEEYKLNVCEYFLKDLWRPSTHIKIDECIDPISISGALKCSTEPICCVPHACLLNPSCTIRVPLTDFAEGLVDGDLTCNFGWVTGDYLIQLVFGGRLGPGAGFDDVKEVARLIHAANLTKLRSDAVPVSAPLERLVLEIVGKPQLDKFNITSDQLKLVKLVSKNSSSTASLYLPGDREAITLGDVIVFNDNYYQLLVASTFSATLYDIQDNNAIPPTDYLEAVSILIHEMVHVDQYRKRGDADFIDEYFINRTVFDGCNHDMEIPAYDYEIQLSNFWQGRYCTDTHARLGTKSASCSLPSSLNPCSTGTLPLITNGVLRPELILETLFD